MADASKWGIYQDVLVQQNTDYTFSIDVNAQLWMECRALTTTTSADGTITPTGIVANSGWDEQFVDNDYDYDNRRYSKTFNTGNYKAYRFFLYGYNLMYGYDTNKASFFNHPQLEIGNKATDWTPSPLDNKEEIDEKASKDDINMIINTGAKNVLKNTKFEEDTTEAIIISEDLSTRSYNGWSLYNVSNEEEFGSSGDMWWFTDTEGNDYELFGYQLLISGNMGEGSGLHWSDACMYQDVELKPDLDYVFSTYTLTDNFPYIQIVARDDGEDVPDTGFDSRDVAWESIQIDTGSNSGSGLYRVYKTFNTGDYYNYRIKVLGCVDYEYEYGDWICYVSGMNYLQLERGTTPTQWIEGYDAIMDLQRQIADCIIQQNELTTKTNNINYTLDRTSNSIQGYHGGNEFYDSDWRGDECFSGFPLTNNVSDITQYKWVANNTPTKESNWGTLSSGYTFDDIYEWSTRTYHHFEVPVLHFSYDTTGETHSAGDIKYLDGGVYQDVRLNSQTTYTFSVLAFGYSGDNFGTFIDCKALSSSSPHSIIANTGFNIQEWEHYSGSKNWVEEWPYNYGGIRRYYITFNTGSYNYYRFRVYGAIYWDSASSFTKYYPRLTRFSLKRASGTEYSHRCWEAGPEYGLKNLYYQSSISGILDTFYPVGSYYETSDTNFNPNTAWGGIWILETAGMVHVSSGTGYTVSGANSADGAGAKDGGAATVALTAAQTGIRNHTHTYSDYNTTYTLGTTKRKPGTSTAVAYGTSLTAGGGATTRTSKNPASEQSGAAHENMPPYIVVNRWHRTA